MRARSWILVAAFFVGSTSLFAESACSIGWQMLNVGTVEGKPITGEVTLTSHEFWPEGLEKPDPNPTVYRIAREGNGRVAIWRPNGWSSAKPRVTTSWEVFICDPHEETTTSFYTNPPNPDITISKWQDPGLMQVVRGQFTSPPGVPKGWQIDFLGAQEFAGVPARGYRLSAAPQASTGLVIFKEQWFSEDLDMEVSHVDRGSGMRAVLTKLIRQEPDPALFAIPPDRKIVRR